MVLIDETVNYGSKQWSLSHWMDFMLITYPITLSYIMRSIYEIAI
jgi:hypothetical protein